MKNITELLLADLKRENSSSVVKQQQSIGNNSSPRIIDEEDIVYIKAIYIQYMLLYTVYIKANSNTSAEMQEDQPVIAPPQSMVIPTLVLFV